MGIGEPKTPSVEKGKGLTGIQERLQKAQQKIVQIREGQAKTRQEIAEEIIAMEEGNRALFQRTESQRDELGKGYREIEEEKEKEILEFVKEVQKRKEELAAVRSETARLAKERESDPSLAVDLPSEEELNELEEGLKEEEKRIGELRAVYNELIKRHRGFAEEQVNVSRDPRSFATEQVIRTKEEATGKQVSKEERGAIGQEVEKGMRRRSDEKNRIREEELQRQHQEYLEKIRRELNEVMDTVEKELGTIQKSLSQRLKDLGEKLASKEFKAEIAKKWAAIDRDIALKGSGFQRILSLTREGTVKTDLRERINALQKELEDYREEATKIYDVIEYFLREQRRRLFAEEKKKNLSWVINNTENYSEGRENNPLKELRVRANKLFDHIDNARVSVAVDVKACKERLDEVFKSKRLHDIKDRYYYIFS